jgi:hypothetical protein
MTIDALRTRQDLFKLHLEYTNWMLAIARRLTRGDMPNATTGARGRDIGQKLHESCQRLGVRVNTHPFCTPPDIESSTALVFWLQAQGSISVEVDREIQERDNPLAGTTPHDLDLAAEKLRAALDRALPKNVTTPAEAAAKPPFQMKVKTDSPIPLALAKAGGTMTHEEIEQEIRAVNPKGGISVRTIGERLAAFRKAGVTHRPNGNRGGDALTEFGKSLCG